LWQCCHVHGVFLLRRRRRNVVHIPGGARRTGLTKGKVKRLGDSTRVRIRLVSYVGGDDAEGF
jgi:hypothetical protein